jgi:mannose-6-phosphate isomerase-like protein (cupin superfamily)
LGKLLSQLWARVRSRTNVKHGFVIVLLFVAITTLKAQHHLSTDTVGLKSVSDNLYNKPAFSDSLASSFVIVIKKEVKAHKHITHAEHVIVLSGSGEMTLGEKTFEIKKGDLVFIPKNTFHSVKTTGKEPLKVVSVQAPFFDGKDRIFKE